MVILSVTGSLLVFSITLVTQFITSAAHVIQQRPHRMIRGSFSSCVSHPQFSLSFLPAVNVDHEDVFDKASNRERETLAYMRNRRQASCVRQCHRYRWIQVRTTVSTSLCFLYLTQIMLMIASERVAIPCGSTTPSGGSNRVPISCHLF